MLSFAVEKKKTQTVQFPVVFLVIITSSALFLLFATVSLYWWRDFLIPLKFMKTTDVMFFYYRLDLYPFALYDVGVFYSFIGLQIFLTLTCLPELLKQWTLNSQQQCIILYSLHMMVYDPVVFLNFSNQSVGKNTYGHLFKHKTQTCSADIVSTSFFS